MSRLVRLLPIAAAFVFAMAAAVVPDDGAIGAEEAVRRSIDQPAIPLSPSWILMDVCGSGEDRGRGYLNSMRDYRDRGSLNVELTPDVRAGLLRRLGGDPVALLPGRRIAVYGSARQVRINWYRDGVATGEFYFQTQLRLASPDHLELVVEDDGHVPANCGEFVS